MIDRGAGFDRTAQEIEESLPPVDEILEKALQQGETADPSARSPRDLVGMTKMKGFNGAAEATHLHISGKIKKAVRYGRPSSDGRLCPPTPQGEELSARSIPPRPRLFPGSLLLLRLLRLTRGTRLRG